MISPDSTLESKRLYFKKLTISDAQAIFEMFSDPEVTRYWSSPAIKDFSEAEGFIKQTEAGFDDGSLLEWGIGEKKAIL